MHDDMMVYICKSTGASVKWVIFKGNYLTHTYTVQTLKTIILWCLVDKLYTHINTCMYACTHR